MTVTKTFQGALRITAMVNGYYVTRQYFGYTRKQAISIFKAEMAERNN